MFHAAFGRQAGLWALGVFIPAVMVPLMIYHAGVDAWQDSSSSLTSYLSW